MVGKRHVVPWLFLPLLVAVSTAAHIASFGAVEEVEATLRQAYICVDAERSPIEPMWNATGSSSSPTVEELQALRALGANCITLLAKKTAIVRVCKTLAWETTTYWLTKPTNVYYARYPDTCNSPVSFIFGTGSQYCGITAFGSDPYPDVINYCNGFQEVPSIATTFSNTYRYNETAFVAEQCSNDSALGVMVEERVLKGGRMARLNFQPAVKEATRASVATIGISSAFAVSATTSYGVEVSVAPSFLQAALFRGAVAADTSDPSHTHFCVLIAPSLNIVNVSVAASSRSPSWSPPDAAAADAMRAALFRINGGRLSAFSELDVEQDAAALLTTLRTQNASAWSLLLGARCGLASLSLGGGLELCACPINETHIHSSIAASQPAQLVVVTFAFAHTLSWSASRGTRSLPPLMTASPSSRTPSVTLSPPASTTASPSTTPLQRVAPRTASSSRTLHVQHYVMPGAAKAVEELLGNEKAARAIVEGGSAATVISGLASVPSIASYSSRIVGMSRVVECDFADRVDGNDALPAANELPLYFALGYSRLRYFAGGVVLTGFALVLLPSLVAAYIHCLLVSHGTAPAMTAPPRANDRHSPRSPSLSVLANLQRNFVSTAATVLTAYFGPSVVGDSALLLTHEGGDAACLLGGLSGLLIVCACTACPCVGVIRLTLHSKSSDGGGEWDFARPLHVSLWAFGESAADLGRLLSRICYFIELGVSFVICVLGAFPPLWGSCVFPVAAMIVVTLLHVAYLLLAGPYRSRLDASFSLVSGCVQSFVALSLLLVVLRGSDSVWLRVSSSLVIVQSLLFFLQGAANVAVQCAVTARRRVISDAEAPSSMSTLSVPLAVEMSVSNPLQVPA